MGAPFLPFGRLMLMPKNWAARNNMHSKCDFVKAVFKKISKNNFLT
jgi:hypothetical protein